MKVLIAGDFCPQQRVAKDFEKNDFESALGEIKTIIKQADYSIVNFECPICYGDEKPIEKCGPNLYCTEKGIEAVKWAGFNCITLANNHFFDYGEEGVRNTLKACARNNIDMVGGGMNIEASSRTLYCEIGGKKLAIINCCEHEFSIANENHAGSNPLNPIQQYYAIKEAQSQADYVLVIVHGGHEHYQLPSPRMQETYRFFIDAGATAVVNHHQHCFSGYELYKGRLILYGLGNFCFDSKTIINGDWNFGYTVLLDFKDLNFQIIPYKQCSEEPTIKILDMEEREAFNLRIEELNSYIQNCQKLKQSFDNFLKKTDNDLKVVFSPYLDRISLGACRRGLLPPLLCKQKLKMQLAYLQCESHYQRVMFFLNERIK